MYSFIKIHLVQNKGMFMNKQHDHWSIQYLKVSMEQSSLMVKLELEKHLPWKVNIRKEILMEKKTAFLGVRSQPELHGIIPSSFAHIFDSISHSTSRQFLVRASYLEIYNESIRDLLSRDQNKRLQLQEHPKEGVHVHDLSSFITKNMQEIEHVMITGNLNRSTG